MKRHLSPQVMDFVRYAPDPVYEVASFYAMYDVSGRKHSLHLHQPACALSGADDRRAPENRLGID